MPEGSQDSRRSSLPPPGFTSDSSTLKRVQLIELLEKLREKIQHEPEFVAQQTKETDLLLSIAQLTLLSAPNSPRDERRDFLNQIQTIGQELIVHNSEVKDTLDHHAALLTDSSPSSGDTPDPMVTDLANDEGDGDLSLDDLASEYLEGDTSPSSVTNKATGSSESNKTDFTLDDLSKTYLSSTPSTTNSVPSLPSSDPAMNKSQLELILFSNRLSSHDAADDADEIWKDESSQLGKIFCTKTAEIPVVTTQRISTCLLDRSLYERLTRLIARLPKQCILRYSAPQSSFRPNDRQMHRPPRPNNDHRRAQHRPSFQENFSQAQSMQHYPSSQNARQYNNPNYGNQQGHFIDRRSQQQQQNRYSHASQSYADAQQTQQKGPPPKHNAHAGGSQQPKKNNNQHRGPKKDSGGNSGNKLTNEKSGAPGSGPNLNPK